MKKPPNFICILLFIIALHFTPETILSHRLCVFAGPAQPGHRHREVIELNAELRIEKIKNHVFVAIHEFPWPANSLIVEMLSGDIIMVDTPYTPQATHVLLKWIKQEFGDREIMAINSHFHFDNLGGNKSLIDNGIPVYGSFLTKKLLKERGERMRAQILGWLHGQDKKRFLDEYNVIPLVPPDHLFHLNENPVFHFTNETVEIFYPGKSHSPDNVVVCFPEKDLLFGSCMVKDLKAKTLGNTSDADLRQWPSALEAVLKKYGEIHTVIPGHGQWGGGELIEHTQDLLKGNK